MTETETVSEALSRHEADCPVCKANYAPHCHERETVEELAELRVALAAAEAERDRYLTRAVVAESQRDDLLTSDWLGLLTRQPNFGDNGTHTWADSIAAYLDLQATDDAQTLYLKLVERDGTLVEAERQRDEALAALGKVREFANHLRNERPLRMPNGTSVQFGSAFADAILTAIGGKP